jgi:hypothetical protein
MVLPQPRIYAPSVPGLLAGLIGVVASFSDDEVPAIIPALDADNPATVHPDVMWHRLKYTYDIRHIIPLVGVPPNMQ